MLSEFPATLIMLEVLIFWEEPGRWSFFYLCKSCQALYSSMKTYSLDLSQKCESGFSIIEEEHFFSLKYFHFLIFACVLYSWYTLGKAVSLGTHNLPEGTSRSDKSNDSICTAGVWVTVFTPVYSDRYILQNFLDVNLLLFFFLKNVLFNVLKLCQDKHHPYLHTECLTFSTVVVRSRDLVVSTPHG